MKESETKEIVEEITDEQLKEIEKPQINKEIKEPIFMVENMFADSQI